MEMVRCYTDNPLQRREGSDTNRIKRRPPRDYWGHKMKKKSEKNTRICFANVRGIGLQASGYNGTSGDERELGKS